MEVSATASSDSSASAAPEASRYAPEGWVRRSPGGRAHSTYSRPCPGCHREINAGDTVQKIELRGQAARWWHIECRQAALEALRVEPQD